MGISITGVNVEYSNGEVSGAKVRFTSSWNDGGEVININGNLPLSKEEYFSNKETDELKEIVRTKLVERLQLNTEETK